MNVEPRAIYVLLYTLPVIQPEVSHKLFSLWEKYGLLQAAQFVYRKGLASTDALLTISHHLQKSLDAGMESYIVHLDFSAAFG